MSDINEKKAIQILGLREHTYIKKIKTTVFLEKNWRAPSVAHLFEHIEDYLAQIPEEERYNLFYTPALTFEGAGRTMYSLDVLYFDIDNIDVTKIEVYIGEFFEYFKLKKEETGILFSGNGIQFIIGLNSTITEPAEFFETYRPAYKELCQILTRRLKEKGLQGNYDTAVFSETNLLRLPLTINRKEGKPTRTGVLYNRIIKPVSFRLEDYVKITPVDENASLKPSVYKKLRPDTKAVIEGCSFLKDCRDYQETTEEQNWYKMLSIVGRLEGGEKLCHEFSKKHKSYSQAETTLKIAQALRASGPRTCKNIEESYDGCATCPNYEKVTSPILIRNKKFIASEKDGFYEVLVNNKGIEKKGKPCHRDLALFFDETHPFVVTKEDQTCYIFNGKKYETIFDSEIKSFAENHFDPKPTESIRMEFLSTIRVTNQVNRDWFRTSVQRKMNFQNGVLDLETMEFTNHSKDFGFMYVLPYSYDPEAKAPTYEHFMRKITKNRQDLIDILEEFAGYCLSGEDCWIAKCLILTGHGSNGKSTFMNLLKNLAGTDNTSAITLQDLRNEVSRASLDGKLFNIADETPLYSAMENSAFKSLVSGEEVQVKKLYKQPYHIKNKAKFIFSCNELPRTNDTTYGYFRRLIIVPFDQRFTETDKDFNPWIEQDLLKELPGILNRLLKAYERLKNNKRFTTSTASIEEIESYKEDIDSVSQWLNECVVIEDPDHKFKLKLREVYNHFKIFAEQIGVRPMDLRTFKKKLERLLPDFQTRCYRVNNRYFISGLVVNND